MRFGRVVLLALICSSAVSGQTSTLPDGLLREPGRAVTPYPFDRGDFRYQEVHSSWRGKPKRLLGVAFRRAWEQPVTVSAVARTALLKFTVGYGDRVTFSSVFGANYLKNTTPLVVFPTTKVSLPAWVNPPRSTAPAPFNVRLPFKRPFIYSGKADFVWEIEHTSASVAPNSRYYSDRAVASRAGYATPTYYGTGCTTKGQSRHHWLEARFLNNGPKAAQPMRLGMQTFLGPVGAVVVGMVGIQRKAISVPGWCAQLLVDPLVFYGIGKVAAGNPPRTPFTYLDLPHIRQALGVVLHCQAFCLDAGQSSGLSLTHGNALRVPNDPFTLSPSWKYIYKASASNVRGPFTTGSVITGWY